jgi:hypothetical protein
MGNASVLVDEPVPHVDIDDTGLVGAAPVKIVQERNIGLRTPSARRGLQFAVNQLATFPDTDPGEEGTAAAPRRRPAGGGELRAGRRSAKGAWRVSERSVAT